MVGPEWFRLQPTDEQLVRFLEMKRLKPAFDELIIKKLNVYNYHPSELHGLSLTPDEQVCYFYCTLDAKHGKGKLKNRKAKGGFWKDTCRGRSVMAKDSKKQIGIRKTFSFYEGSTSKKENRTEWKMYEYHEYPRKDNSSSQGEVVVCRIEKKPDKKRKSSSSLDQGQTSDSLANDFGNNVSEDILQAEPQPPQNLHLPSSYSNNVANSNLMEMETHPPPNHHISHVTNDIIQEQEAQLPSNQHIPSNGEDDVANYIVPEMESQLLPKQSMSPIIGDLVAKYIFPEVRPPVPAQQDEPVVFNGLDHNSFSTLQSPLHMTPGFSYSSSFNNDSVPSLNQNSFSALQSPIRPPPGFLYYGSSSNNSTNGLDYNSFSALEFPIHPLPESSYSINGLDYISALWSPVCTPPGFSYSSSFNNDSVPLLNQNSFSAPQSPIHLPPGCLYYGSSSNNSTNGLDYNSFSALEFPVHPLPESSYSINRLDYISASQSPVCTPPGSSYSSCFSNDSNVWTPQFAAEPEDDFANSNGSAQDDFHKLH